MPSYRTAGAKTVTWRPFNPASKKFSGPKTTVKIPAGSIFTYSSQYPEVAAMFADQVVGWAPVPGG